MGTQSAPFTSTQSGTIITDETDNYILVLNSETLVPQMIIGLLPDGTYGMVISNVGVNVLTLFS